MKVIFETNSKKEANAILSLDKLNYAVNSIRDLITSLEKGDHSSIYVLYRNKLRPISELDMNKLEGQTKMGVKKYIEIDDIIPYLEDIIKDIPED